jgi:hypothetical protein
MTAPSRRRSLDRLIDTYLRAETEADVDTILSLVTNEIQYEELGAIGTACGMDAVRARYQQEFANTIHESGASLRRWYGNGVVVDERTWEGRVIGRLGPFVGGGRRISHRTLHVFVLRGDHIAFVSVYQDFAAIMRQLS